MKKPLPMKNALEEEERGPLHFGGRQAEANSSKAVEEGDPLRVPHSNGGTERN